MAVEKVKRQHAHWHCGRAFQIHFASAKHFHVCKMLPCSSVRCTRGILGVFLSCPIFVDCILGILLEIVVAVHSDKMLVTAHYSECTYQANVDILYNDISFIYKVITFTDF